MSAPFNITILLARITASHLLFVCGMSHQHVLPEIPHGLLAVVVGGDWLVNAIDAVGPVAGPAYGLKDWKTAPCLSRATTGAEVVGLASMAVSTVAGAALGQKAGGIGGGLWGGVAGNVGGNVAKSVIRGNVQNRYLATCGLK